MRAVAALAALFFLATPAAAAPEPRVVLAPYLPKLIPGERPDVYFTPMHQQAEMPLNYLGLIVEYVDASKPLPDPAARPDVRGVVTWFTADASFDDPQPFCRWLAAGLARGWKVAMVGRLGVFPKGRPAPQAACAAALRTLGVEARANHPTEPLDVAVASATALVGFERAPDPTADALLPMARLLPDAKGSVQLALAVRDAPWPRTEPVALTPRGGVALDPFAFYQNNEVSPPQFRWILDPFAFFERALGTRGLPRPDVTTLSGRRIFMTHVDGDGFFNLSELDRTKTSGEIFLREFVDAMPDTPFTLSLIAAYYDLDLYNDGSYLEMSRRALTRPNVEPASHAYTHPLDWAKKKVALNVPRYKYDTYKEVVESGRILSKTLLSGKPIGLFLWTGDCLPPEEAVGHADAAGLLQMNGGGGAFDRRTPSYAYVFPLSRSVGKRRQIYAPQSNENVYTRLWTGPYYGYREVVDTFENTGAPRRIKPVDVYVHFYSAERFAAVQALKTAYAWARQRPLIPVFAGRYARAAKDFFEMKIVASGPRRWKLEGGPAVRTVRFDDEAGAPDIRASKGVVGWRREGAALYVSLDETSSREIVLGPARESGPRLEEASFEAEGWTLTGGGVKFRKRGWWRSEAVLGGLVPGRAYRVTAGGPPRKETADVSGRLKLDFGDGERLRPAADVEVAPL